MYDFLVGLNSKFDQVRIQILGKGDVPSLEEAISLICVEESQRIVMLEPQSVDESTLATKTNHLVKD